MPSRPEQDGALLEVARILKTHGLSGELVVELWSDRAERLAAGSRLSSEMGTLQVLASRRHHDSKGARHHRYLVRFDGVVDRQRADSLRGVVLLAEPIDAPGELWVHELVGAEVVTTDGRGIGHVESVEPNPASDLLVLESGALVPLRFVVERRSDGQLTVDIPEGLLD